MDLRQADREAGEYSVGHQSLVKIPLSSSGDPEEGEIKSTQCSQEITEEGAPKWTLKGREVFSRFTILYRGAAWAEAGRGFLQVFQELEAAHGARA